MTTGATVSYAIKPIETRSIHRITSGQVVIDLATAVKELVENSLDAGATSIDVRFKDYGLTSIEVVDNGSGIAPQDYDSVALKHRTSKLTTFSDLSSVLTFGFRGEALSSLCALCETVVVATARKEEAPMGTVLEMDSGGKVVARSKAARQRGTTVLLTNLFTPLPVRRKEFERNAKREFGKALNLLNAYALVPCSQENRGVRLTVTNQIKGKKTNQLRTDGTPSVRSSISSLWGPRALDHIAELDVVFQVDREKNAVRRLAAYQDSQEDSDSTTQVRVRGLVSKFAVGCGRTGTDRQFFFVNGRPCNLGKIQKAFNEIYRSFNATQSPMIVADFTIPTAACDINVSPDKRTIFLHSEGNLITALKAALEQSFAPSRSTYDVAGSQAHATQASTPRFIINAKDRRKEVVSDDDEEADDAMDASIGTGGSTPANLKISSRPERSPDKTLPRAPSRSNADGFVADEDVHIPDATLDDSPDADFSMQCNAPSSQPSASQTASHESGSARVINVSSSHDEPPIAILATPRSSGEGDRSLEGSGRKLVQTVISTRGTLWHRQASQAASATADTENDDALGPPRKKRRSDVSLVNKSGAQGSDVLRKSGKAHRGKAAQRDLRSQLNGFARSGSQIIAQNKSEEEEEDEDEDEEGKDKGVNEDEGIHSDDIDEDKREERQQATNLSTRDLFAKGEAVADDSISADEGIALANGPDTSMAGSGVIDLTEEPRDDRSTSVSGGASTASSNGSSDAISRPEVIRLPNGPATDVTLRFDLAKLSDTWRKLYNSLAEASQVLAAGHSARPRVTLDAGVSNPDDDAARDALARTIDKEDFGFMEIVGQFNLGFIVTRRQRSSPDSVGDELVGMMDDLFIVDQHAADEKYNFETLQQTTSIQSQRLFRPEPLELTAADELLAIDNIDVLRRNGFEIDVDNGDVASGMRHRLQLVAQPVSKSTVFDMHDLQELIHLMQDRPTGQMVRCSKARAMFAMRACRKSIMVGMPLTRGQMATASGAAPV